MYNQKDLEELYNRRLMAVTLLAHWPELESKQWHEDTHNNAGDQINAVVVKNAQSTHMTYSLARGVDYLPLRIDTRELQQSAQHRVQQRAEESR